MANTHHTGGDSRRKLAVDHIKGSPRQCGREYGERFADLIMGFCRKELAPDKKKLAYARQCWRHVAKSAPESAEFLRGEAEGAKLSLDHVTLLALHEEIYHVPHCTAFAATAPATRGGATIAGMNWDWSTALYPWPGLLKMSMTGGPRTASYHYPGLWQCAGINDAGLAFVWTGGGYFPYVKPVVGVPTYVLIAELLRKKSVYEVTQYLATVKHAGSFIFFLADASGAMAIVEAVPGKTHLVRPVDQRGGASGDASERPSGDARSTKELPGVLVRGNHYFCGDVLACGKQVAPSPKKATTLQRTDRMAALVRQHHGRIGVDEGKAFLLDRHGPWPWLNQFPAGRDAVTLGGMTIDSILTHCNERALLTCRGGRTPGPWQTVTA